MAKPTAISTEALARIALTIRQRTIENSARARIPHLGSCLSCVELLTALYWKELCLDPKNPDAPNRDRFVLSKGHGAPVLFQVLAERGFFPVARLAEFGQPGSVFHEHPPKPGYIPGVEAATGSLGHGLPMALGMAISQRIQGSNSRCYALLSDGECNEGSIWEAAMLAGLDYANGRCAAAVLIDSDLQQPPERIPAMVQAWRRGAEVVTAVRDDRDAEGLVKVATASWFIACSTVWWIRSSFRKGLVTSGC